jgi:hypothetical protein
MIQLFTHVETLERENAELRPVLRTVDRGEFALHDVQIFPRLKAISFRLAGGTRFPDARTTLDDSRVCSDAESAVVPGLGTLHLGETMTTLRTLEDRLSENASIDDVLATLASLRSDLRDHPEAWENSTLERYLEALEAWLTDVRERVSDKPSWQLLVAMLSAARVYE